MSLDDWNDGWIDGQRDMLAKCIALLEAELEVESEDRVDGIWDAIVALRALQDRTENGTELTVAPTLQKSGREPNNYPVGYDPRAAENRP